jgi:serine/threonine-protein kinase RsbW
MVQIGHGHESVRGTCAAMRMKVAFWLSRTPDSVAIARTTLDQIFKSFGVTADCREEIALAVTEACSNAVRHASGAQVYEVAAESDDSQCVITVNDDGPGLEHKPPGEMPPPDTPHGRGFALVRMVVDRVQLRRRTSGGLSVRLFKRLRWHEGAFGHRAP